MIPAAANPAALAARAANGSSRIDAHLHLWDIEAGESAWLRPEHGELYATFTAGQARAELDAAGIDAAVLVQAEDSEQDTAFMLDAASANPWVAGVVGWVPIDDAARAERLLDRWQEHPAFCGVRQLLHDDPRDGVLASAQAGAVARLLADRGLPLDIPDAFPRLLADAGALAAAVPGLTIVIDHLAKPPAPAGAAAAGAAAFAAWREQLAAVAARPNTVAKFSGLQPFGQALDAAAVRPVWELALELFGPDRLMYGGDWPMTVTAGGYQRVWEILSGFIGELSEPERDRVLGGTAAAVYGLDPAPLVPG